ncbi:general substrate transporter [Auriculariales sp. MPI-PUGE-AT-0066]|nr:general substrate transporter [Auriculariales sp. MPI-PUGE-AT-0066]
MSPLFEKPPSPKTYLMEQHIQHYDGPKGFAILRKKYTWYAVFVSSGAFLFGYDTGSIGPVTVMPQYIEHFGNISPVLHGIIVSCILLTAALFSVVAGPLADRISRTRTIALGGVVSAIGEAICLAATRGNLGMFIAGRAIAGMGEGLFMSPITTYICEIAPTPVRGRLTVQIQLFVTLGLLCGYFTCYGSQKAEGSIAWRVPYMLQIVFSAFMAAGSFMLPHSPRWLQHVGRDADVDRALTRLGVTAVELGLEPAAASHPRPVTVAAEKGTAATPARKTTSLSEQWLSLWRKDVRTRTALAVYLNFGQQASGIDGVLYYAPALFAQAGLASSTASFLASGVVGIVIFLVTIPVLIYSDTWGRRPPMIWGGLVLSLSLLIIGTLHASHASDHKGAQYTIIGLIFVYVMAFSMSWAVIIRGYSAEIQPMRTRAPATALGQGVNWLVNWIVAFTTPMFLAKSTSGPYFLFGGCSLLTTAICFLYARESLGMSLEDIEKEFDIITWTPRSLSRTTTRSAQTSQTQQSNSNHSKSRSELPV